MLSKSGKSTKSGIESSESESSSLEFSSSRVFIGVFVFIFLLVESIRIIVTMVKHVIEKLLHLVFIVLVFFFIHRVSEIIKSAVKMMEHSSREQSHPRSFLLGNPHSRNTFPLHSKLFQ